MYVCTHMQTQVHEQICSNMCMPSCTHTHTHMHTYMLVSLIKCFRPVFVLGAGVNNKQNTSSSLGIMSEASVHFCNIFQKQATYFQAL